MNSNSDWKTKSVYVKNTRHSDMQLNYCEQASKQTETIRLHTIGTQHPVTIKLQWTKTVSLK